MGRVPHTWSEALRGVGVAVGARPSGRRMRGAVGGAADDAVQADLLGLAHLRAALQHLHTAPAVHARREAVRRRVYVSTFVQLVWLGRPLWSLH